MYMSTEDRDVRQRGNQNGTWKSMIRINHAGEYAAKRLYEGQIRHTKDPKARAQIQRMLEQESKHLEFFDEEIKKRRARPSVLHPVIGAGYYLLGAISARISPKAAFLCTKAIEDVIVEHYDSQIKELKDTDKGLKAKIEQFKEEEEEHGHTASEYDSSGIAMQILEQGLKATCKLGIKLTKYF